MGKELKKSICDGKRKYLFIVALLVLVAFCCYFHFAFKSFESALIEEQAWEKQQDVNLLCGIVDKLIEMDDRTGKSYDYQEVIQFAVQYIETNYVSTFAQIYDDTLCPLTTLSPGVGGGQKHNPLNYPVFVEAVKSGESGSLVYWYETEEAGGRYVHMCFRWVPTDTSHTSRYLVAVGISRYTIRASIDWKITYGAVLLIVVSAIFIIATVVLLCRIE